MPDEIRIEIDEEGGFDIDYLCGKGPDCKKIVDKWAAMGGKVVKETKKKEFFQSKDIQKNKQTLGGK